MAGEDIPLSDDRGATLDLNDDLGGLLALVSATFFGEELVVGEVGPDGRAGNGERGKPHVVGNVDVLVDGVDAHHLSGLRRNLDLVVVIQADLVAAVLEDAHNGERRASSRQQRLIGHDVALHAPADQLTSEATDALGPARVDDDLEDLRAEGKLQLGVKVAGDLVEDRLVDRPLFLHPCGERGVGVAVACDLEGSPQSLLETPGAGGVVVVDRQHRLLGTPLALQALLPVGVVERLGRSDVAIGDLSDGIAGGRHTDIVHDQQRHADGEHKKGDDAARDRAADALQQRRLVRGLSLVSRTILRRRGHAPAPSRTLAGWHPARRP